MSSWCLGIQVSLGFGVWVLVLPRRKPRPCSREDSNLHGLPHTVLSRTRLPVPPRELMSSPYFAHRSDGRKLKTEDRRQVAGGINAQRSTSNAQRSMAEKQRRICLPNSWLGGFQISRQNEQNGLSGQLRDLTEGSPPRRVNCDNEVF